MRCFSAALCVLTVFLLLFSHALAAEVSVSGKELDEAMRIIRDCETGPGDEEIEKLRALGFSDEDIEDLITVASLSPEEPIDTAVFYVIAALTALGAAAVAVIGVIKYNKSRS